MGFSPAKNKRRKHCSCTRNALLGEQIGLALRFEDRSEIGFGVGKDVFVYEDEE